MAHWLAREAFLSSVALTLVVACSASEEGPLETGSGGSGKGGASTAVSGGSTSTQAGKGGSSNGGLTASNGGAQSSGGALNGGAGISGGTTNGGSSNGGATNGGSSNGGTLSGGASNGGASNGGSSNGGAFSGGAANGGASSGGSLSGGASSGGTGAGGANRGGASNGGTASGGTGAGGANRGGASNGGAANGGSGTGGASKGGASSGGANSSGGTSGLGTWTTGYTATMYGDHNSGDCAGYPNFSDTTPIKTYTCQSKVTIANFQSGTANNASYYAATGDASSLWSGAQCNCQGGGTENCAQNASPSCPAESASGGNCGICVAVKCDPSGTYSYGGTTHDADCNASTYVVVQVIDACPHNHYTNVNSAQKWCTTSSTQTANHIDLSCSGLADISTKGMNIGQDGWLNVAVQKVDCSVGLGKHSL